jgi:hypothetical protein
MPRGIVTTFVLVLAGFTAVAASAQSFKVQCPISTITHPSNLTNVSAEPNYTGPTVQSLGSGGYLAPSSNVNGAIKCQQISGGDGYSTMANGTQTFMFSFGPLSGLADIAKGRPGTEFAGTFNSVVPGTLQPGDPATTDDANSLTPYNSYNYYSNTNLTGSSSIPFI